MSGGPRFERFFEAEQEARRLTPHVVVEVRCEGDPPGVEATFVVCPESDAHMVRDGHEIVFTAGEFQLTVALLRSAMREALASLDEAYDQIGTKAHPAIEGPFQAARAQLEAGLYGSALGTGRRPADQGGYPVWNDSR